LTQKLNILTIAMKLSINLALRTLVIKF